MTTDDLREIEAALDDFPPLARERVLALIRQKLPQTDADHERAVEAWVQQVKCLGRADPMKDFYLIEGCEIDEALRLMRARPTPRGSGSDAEFDPEYPQRACDWPVSDGTYWCMCSTCERQFRGNKRRVTCRVCAGTKP